jgi:hypothetical protein
MRASCCSATRHEADTFVAFEIGGYVLDPWLRNR